MLKLMRCTTRSSASLITYMMEDPRVIGHCSQLLFIAKNLERIGDHATFISEMTYFVAEGIQTDRTIVRPKGDPIGEMLPEFGGLSTGAG